MINSTNCSFFKKTIVFNDCTFVRCLKTPYEGTVIENYSLLKEGAIGRVNHITFDLKDSDPFLNYVEGQSIGTNTLTFYII